MAMPLGWLVVDFYAQVICNDGHQGACVPPGKQIIRWPQ